MIFNVGAGGTTDADKIKYGDSNVGATLDNLNESVDELNNSLGGLRFGYDGDSNAYGYYGADDSFIPFKSGVMFLYDYGDMKTNITGGWENGVYTSDSTYSRVNCEFNSDYIRMPSDTNKQSVLTTVNKIDLTNVDILVVEYEQIKKMASEPYVAICTSKNDYISKVQVLNAQAEANSNRLVIDVSKLTDSYYIIMQCGNKREAHIKRVYGYEKP